MTNACTYLTHIACQDIEHILHPRKISWALSSQFNSILVLSFPSPNSQATTVQIFFTIVLLIIEHHMYRIIQYVCTLVSGYLHSVCFWGLFHNRLSHNLIIQLMDIWIIYSFWLLWTVECYEHSCIVLFVDICFYFSWVKGVELSKSRIVGSWGRYIFIFIKNCQTVPQSGSTCTSNSIKVLVASHSHKHLILSSFQF